MNTIGIIGCILGFVCMGFLTYRGWHVAIGTLVGALIVAVTNGLPIVEAYVDSYLPGVGGFLSVYFGMFIFGALLAELYAVSGAGLTVALAISKTFIKDSFSPKFKRCMVLFVMIIISAVLEYAGVGASLIVMVVYPVALSLFAISGIPKRYIVASVLGGCLGFANGLPGSPQPGNTVPMKILGTSSTAALVPGLIGAVVEIIVMVVLLSAVIERGIKKGEYFDANVDIDRKVDESNKRPPLWLTLVPAVVLFVLFNIVKLEINITLMIACLVAFIAFYRYIPKGTAKSSVSTGITQGIVATVSVCCVIGFSTVVQSTAAFQTIVSSLLGLKMNPYILIIVCVAFMCMLCGGSATGQAIAIPIVSPVVQAVGVSAEAVHRIASFAGATLDTMPYAGTVVMAHAYANVKIRDGYPAVFVISVIATTISAFVVAGICALFPALAC